MSGTEETPSPVMKGLTFFPVPEFDDAEIGFGAEAQKYFNRRDRPKVPYRYEKIFSELFFKGGSLPEMSPRVDRVKATRAVKAWMTSWGPAHEAKEATVAYALWVWCTLPNEEGTP